MFDDEEILQSEFDNDGLVSIIKIETEQFQDAEVPITSQEKIFYSPLVILFDALKPVVVLDQLTDDTNNRRLAVKTSVLKSRNQKSQTGQKVNKRLIGRLRQNSAYICDNCGNSYASRDGISAHLRYRHLTKPYIFCDLCPKQFNLKSDIRKHMQDKHLLRRKYVCSVCNFRGKSKGSIRIHTRGVHGKRIKCLVCHRFFSPLGLMAHTKRMHPKDGVKEAPIFVPCKICGMAYVNLQPHIRKVHGKNYKCKECGEYFTWRDLRTHTLQVHYTGKLYESKAGKLFKSKSKAKNHAINKISNCELCDRSFRTVSMLYYHWTKTHLQTHGDRRDYLLRIATTPVSL